MSDSSKMGLFGSKDETKETKKESKGRSPDRYAPYCIDSDSETYDTEALSIMDINDIIGVQSEPVSDSTLESEIAALSQMITESKTDGSQSATETNFATPEVDENKEKAVPVGETRDTVQTSIMTKDLKPNVKELEKEKVSCVEETSNDIEQPVKENSQFNNENTLQESLKLCKQEKNDDTQNSCKSDILTECVSVIGINDVKHSKVSNITNISHIQATGDCMLETSEIVKNKEYINKCSGSQQGSSNVEITGVTSVVTIIEKENSIRGSLQLIGEAYSSEDSQESIIISEEPKQTSLITSSNEDSPTLCEENNGREEHCKSEQDVNNGSVNTDNINSDKSCTEKDLVDEIIESKEVYITEVDPSNCSTGSKVLKELTITSEDTKNIPNEYEVNNPSNIVPECDQESMKIAVNGIINIQTKQVDPEIADETVMMVQHETELDEKEEDSTVVTSVGQDEKCEIKITEISAKIIGDPEIVEDMDIEEEKCHKTGECIKEVEEEKNYESEKFIKEAEGEKQEESTEIVNTLAIENPVVNNDDILNTEVADKINKDAKVTQEEVQSENLDDPTTDMSQRDNLLQVADNPSVLEAKSNKLELPQMEKKLDVDRFEVTEIELKQIFEEPVSNASDHFPIPSKQNSIVEQKDTTEFSSKSDKLLNNISSETVSATAHIKMESEEKDNLVSVSSGLTKIKSKDVIIETIETIEICSIQEKSMEMDVDVESAFSMIEKNTNLDIIKSVDINTIEDCSEDKVQQLFKEYDSNTIQDMKVAQMEATKLKYCTSEYQSEISNKVIDTGDKKIEPDKISHVTESLEEHTESKYIKDFVHHKEIKTEGHMGEKMTVDKQIEKKDTVKEQTEGKVIVQEQAENKVVFEGQVEDKAMIKEQIKDKVTAEEQMEDRTMVAGQKEDKALVEEQIMQEKVITDEKMIEQKVIVDEKMLEQKVIVDEEMLEQKVIVDEEIFEQKAIVDKEIFEQKAIVDKEIFEQKVIVDEEMLKPKVIVDEEMLGWKVIVDEEMLEQKVIVNDEKLERKVIADEEMIEQKVVVDEEIPEQKVIIDEEIPVRKVIVDEEIPERKVIVDEEMPERKVIVDEEIPEHNVILDEEILEQNVIVEEEVLEQNVIVEKEVLEQNVIVEEEILEQNVIVEEEILEQNVIVEEEILEQKIIVEKLVDKKMITKAEMVDERTIFEERAKEVVLFTKQLEEESIAVEEMQEGEEEDIPRDDAKQEHRVGRKHEVNELQINENICAVVQGNILEQPKTIALGEEVNIRTEPTTNYANEDLPSDSKFFKPDVFLPSEQIIVPEEDAKEEHIEEEMNLTLEPEETELQTETIKSDIEEKAADKSDKECLEEIVSEDQEDCNVKIDDDTLDSLNIKKSSNMEMEVEDTIHSDNAEDSGLSKTEDLLEKQEMDDSDSKNDSNKDNLKDILESANNVEDMFSGEQCQNTQDIVTSILDNVRSATDFKNILSTAEGVANEIKDVLHQSENLPLAESEIEELTEKLPHVSEDILGKDIDDSISNQNMDSLEGLLGLDLIQEGDDPALKVTKGEDPLQKSEQLSKVVDMSLLLGQSSNTDMAQASDYISHVISSCLTDRDDVPLEDNTEISGTTETEVDKVKDAEPSDMLKDDEIIISEPVNKEEDNEDLQKDLKVGHGLPENEVDIEFEEAALEPVGDFEETETELELASNILLQNVDHGDHLNDAPTGLETSQPSSEISELESAVKFLQESEEQAMDSPLALSPKMVESVVDDISKEGATSSLFVPDEDICESTAELDEELQNIATDSISISEAEIISEAAKLESERKLAEQIKINASKNKFDVGNDNNEMNEGIIKEKMIATEIFNTKFDAESLQNIEMQQTSTLEREKLSQTIATLSQKVLKTSESIPKVSILEERLKEPPKIEIPSTDVTKVSMSPTTSKDSLLIQKDAKLIAYQKMLESPKLSDKSEPKIAETPRKDSEKHDFENVGSPRIILKIAKSAITDCGEPRSPKSPKIRSATNSPNPEDSPGQKLGKIKLKLSKGGHPSIISNENIEEIGQWYSEGSSSLSPIGMKIKLSKSGDASIVSSEKYDTVDDAKESKHKYEEIKRTESPIGMKIKLSKSGDASIVQQDCKELQIKHKDKLDMVQGSPKRTESPIGMKIKFSKTGDASIIQLEKQDLQEEHKDNTHMKSKDRHESCYDSPKRTDSPIGMKIKLSKTGDASIVSPDLLEESKESGKVKDKFESSPEIPKRTESPIGMKIKLAKTKGGASIISMENAEETKDKLEIADIPKRTESPLGMKIKLSKTGDASIVHTEVADEIKEKIDTVQDTVKSPEPLCGMKIKVIRSAEMQTVSQESLEECIENQLESGPKVESPLGMKIKFSKFGDASIVPPERQEQAEENKSLPETPKRTESPLGMKIKLSKTGDASIIQAETSEDAHKIIRMPEADHTKITDATLGMKIKLLKTGDASIVESEKKDRHQRRRDAETPLEMKIKLSKTGHPTIVACDNQVESGFKPKEAVDPSQTFAHRYKDSGQACHKEPTLKILKTGQSTILQSNRAELTIEPVQMQGKKSDNVVEISPKRKDITISPVETKKSKLEAQLTQILPEVTIQPVTNREQKQFLFDPKNNSISLQQMNVINQEISITQVRPQKPVDSLMSEKLKDILSKNASGSPMNSDCEIIEHRPELIIVNENSNSSQDVMIIEEVSTSRMPEVKVPKKRGRPRRNPLPQGITHPPPHMLMPKDALSLDEAHLMQRPQVPHFAESRENERPKRTCRSQKSYAPPKRGRGRGRGKRKMDTVDSQLVKKARLEQDLSAIETSTTAVITIDDPTMQHESFGKSPELYKALKQPAMDSRVTNSAGKIDKKTMGHKNNTSMSTNVHNNTIPESAGAQLEINKIPEMRLPKPLSIDSKDGMRDKKLAEISPERMQRVALKDDRTTESTKSENKEMLVPPGHPHWLTPVSKRAIEGPAKHENVSTVQVIDEETRMSAESGSRSQTPARNISAPASETIVNEESQGSVLSTATTESEKVKVKNRRMEINFDPDEGPFTVDKIAEYEWPLDRKGETFMIQEQISQYLGVKSFKRKYPDLKRRVVDMEERNYLRENGLVSEAMCDMGLTAVCSSEVLDVMCSDFPDQYEEYRKHMREKQVKEHSKKQKELTAAANAEKNRIDLAEMAVQSALSWNISLNKARRENRKCSLDLQTFTIHVPKKQQKVEVERRIGHYPVALIPGQYTDYYREYTPAELRYYPLNTVLYGPMRPNERKFDSQSEGSQSDSDSDSSSDDSSSSSSEGTQDTEGSQSTMDDVDMEIANQKDEVKLKCKMCLKTLNKHSKNEVLIQCGTCNGHVHPSCIDLTLDMVPHIQSYAWQCTDCKTCAQCHDPADEDKMLFCDMCDRGYHIYCVGLRRVPQGRWHCQECAVCANCGSREPGGINSDRNSVAQWQHEYKKGDKNTRVYVSTLCVPCSKLWRKGRYCPHCSRCHTAPRLDLEANLVHCSACDKYLHLGCVETKGVPLDRKNYLCDFCAPNRQHVVKPLVSKSLKT